MNKIEHHEMRILGKKKEKTWNSGLPNPEHKEEPITLAELKYLKDKAAEKDSPT